MEEEKIKRLKEYKKMSDEIKRRKEELYKNYREKVESLYNENIDLIIDGLKKLRGEELNELLQIIEFRLNIDSLTDAA